MTNEYSSDDFIQIARHGSVVYFKAAAAIARGANVALDISEDGQVKVPASGDTIVGVAYDRATAEGQLIRVQLNIETHRTEA